MSKKNKSYKNFKHNVKIVRAEIKRVKLSQKEAVRILNDAVSTIEGMAKDGTSFSDLGDSVIEVMTVAEAMVRHYRKNSKASKGMAKALNNVTSMGKALSITCAVMGAPKNEIEKITAFTIERV